MSTRKAGARVLLTLTHAAGFNAGIYRPILKQLDTLNQRSSLKLHIDCVAPSFYGHGVNQYANLQPTDARAWPQLCHRDVLDAWNHHHPTCEPHPLAQQELSHLHKRSIIDLQLRTFNSKISKAELQQRHAATLAILRKRYDIIIGCGHSMGGATLLGMELMQPDTFDQLLLIEPVLFNTNLITSQIASSPLNPLFRKSRARRTRFASKQDALETYQQRGFRRFDPDSLRGYTDEGLIEHDGSATLACQPEFEANLYRGDNNLWPQLDRCKAQTTIIVATHPMPQAILGTTLQHFDRAAARMMAGQVKVCSCGLLCILHLWCHRVQLLHADWFDVVQEVKGSHFVVMERPGLIANELHDMLSTL
eukprot:m.74764 g.74764  ORF g.74764 m.74764 type:complete len:364 (+) comp14378_c0_seq1:125-1216(+)